METNQKQEGFTLWKKDEKACLDFKKVGYRPPKRMSNGEFVFCDFLGRKKTLKTDGFAEAIKHIEKCVSAMNDSVEYFYDEDEDAIENLEKQMLWDSILHFLDVTGFFPLEKDVFWFQGQLFNSLPLVQNPNNPDEWGIPMTRGGETPIDVRAELFSVVFSLVDYMYLLLKESALPKICQHLIRDEGVYHECGIANKKRTQGEAEAIIGRVAIGFKRLSNIPEGDLQKIAEELRSLVKKHGLKEVRQGVVCAYLYDLGELYVKEDVPWICPLGYTHEQIEAMVKRLNEEMK
jgi:hypothetical protein